MALCVDQTNQGDCEADDTCCWDENNLRCVDDPTEDDAACITPEPTPEPTTRPTLFPTTRGPTAPPTQAPTGAPTPAPISSPIDSESNSDESDESQESRDNANSIYALLNYEIDVDMNSNGNAETITFDLSQNAIIDIWMILLFCLLSLTTFCWLKRKLNRKYEFKIIENDVEVS